MAKQYSAAQAAEVMKLPHREVIRRIKKGDIDAEKLGWVYIVTQKSIDKAMASDWYQQYLAKL